MVLEQKTGRDGKPIQPPREPSKYGNNEIKTYDEYIKERATGNILPYIAGYFTIFPQDGLFTVGNDTTFKVSKRKRRNTGTTSYRNGPLSPETSYVVFQRAFVSDVSLPQSIFTLTVASKVKESCGKHLAAIDDYAKDDGPGEV